jgi:hypothetical protein
MVKTRNLQTNGGKCINAHAKRGLYHFPFVGILVPHHWIGNCPTLIFYNNSTAGQSRTKQILNFKKMKKKSLLLTAVATLGLTAATMAQSNCDLINSATFSVPNNNVIGSFGHVPYVTDTINPFYMPLDISQWQYVAITKDNSNQAKIYKNGQLVFQGNYANVSYFWNRLDLGAVFYTSYGGWFNGFIDEIRLSNTVRTTNDIASYYNSNAPFVSDANTIGLWHFDQNSGTTINASSGTNGSITNATWNAQGKFGQCLSYNGTNARAQINQSIPTSNMTFEFWIKPNILQQSSWPISWYGGNTAGFTTNQDTLVTNYTWSTGATGNSVTINPTTLPYLWVTDGNCTDTIWFNSQSATIYDTTYVTVTDTLLINTSVTGINPPNNVNTIKVFPNPASTHITIDYGNFAIMNGYQLVIENSLGQQVFQTNITQQSDYLSLASWGGNGLYFVHIIDTQGNTIDIRKIVLQ